MIMPPYVHLACNESEADCPGVICEFLQQPCRAVLHLDWEPLRDTRGDALDAPAVFWDAMIAALESRGIQWHS